MNFILKIIVFSGIYYAGFASGTNKPFFYGLIAVAISAVAEGLRRNE